MNESIRILIIDDSQDDADLLIREFNKEGLKCIYQRIETAMELMAALEDRNWDVVLCDFHLPDFSGEMALRILREKEPDLPLIMISGKVKEEVIVEAMKAGANDCILKDNLVRLVSAVKREMEQTVVKKREKATQILLKEKEEQLRQAQKMDALSCLAGGVAQDFNNILAILLINCEMILNKISEFDPLWEEVKQIERAAKRAAHLTRQLLAFCKGQILGPKPLRLNQVITEMENMLVRIVGDNIRLSTEWEENLHSIFFDPSQLEQVILNLVVNAKDSLSLQSGGEIRIKASNIHISDDPQASPFFSKHSVRPAPGRYVVLSILDNGKGLSPEIIDHIFEPFFMNKTAGRGTGLGLSIVFGIVKQGMGAIFAENSTQGGSLFKIYFPAMDDVSREILEGHPRMPASPPPNDVKTVFVVEDNEELRDLLVTVLQAEGYSVLSASSPEKVQSIIQERGEKIHLLVTDILMPEISGTELWERISTQYPQVNVLFISGNPSLPHGFAGIKKGQEFFLQKPFTSAMLIEKVNSLLGGKSRGILPGDPS